MSALRAAASVTLNSPWLLAVAAAASVGEAAVRIALGWLLSPVVAVLAPPVVAVVALGTAVPRVRRHLDADEAATDSSAGDRSRFLPVAGFATAGHAVAVGVGTALFLLVDTPVRAALYWLGHGDALGTTVQLLAPLAGVATGTILAWAVVAAAAVGVVDGATIRRSLTAALGGAADEPRTAAVAAGIHLALAVATLGAVGVGLPYLIGRRSVVTFAAVAGGLGVLVGAFGLAFLAAFHVARGNPTAGTERPAGAVVRLAVAGVLIAALVAGAGAVRVTELRPIDDAREPLPEDPDGAYATAIENTERADHRYRVAIGPDRPEPFVVEHRVDRTDRQYRQRLAGEAVGPSAYASTGTGSPPLNRRNAFLALGAREVGPDGDRTVRAFPDYLLWRDSYGWDGTGGLVPPSSAVDGWEEIDRGDGRIVLELDDPATVFAATQGRAPDRLTNVTTARIRAVIDADRGTLVRIENRFDATVWMDGSPHRIDAHVHHEFEVGYDVERPRALGSPSPGEWLWKLFVY